MRTALGILLGLLARIWLSTLRLRVAVHPSLDANRSWVHVFFHGTQWPLLARPLRRPTAVMVSLSDDGQMQAAALTRLGFAVVRGSSSRGGARGLASMVRSVRRGSDAAFAVDGPRGPYGKVKPGALLCARRAGALVVPMGSAVRGGKTFFEAWDRFALAWPFGKAAVVLGPAVEADDLEAVARAIEEANRAAAALLSECPASVVLSRFV